MLQSGANDYDSFINFLCKDLKVRPSFTGTPDFDNLMSVTSDILLLVSVLASGIQKNRVALDRLKLDSAQELLHVEVAQRTKDTPPSMQ